MFGWLTSRATPLCGDAAQAPVSRRWLYLTPHELARRLPLLGTLLYVHNDQGASTTHTCASRLLVARQELSPFTCVFRLAVACVITNDGPREWCECIDREGRVMARLHLLPDTDYLAWDAMLSDRHVIARPRTWRDAVDFKPRAACITRFQTRTLANFIVLDHLVTSGLSRLGADVAARIAHAEATPLSASPLAG